STHSRSGWQSSRSESRSWSGARRGRCTGPASSSRSLSRARCRRTRGEDSTSSPRLPFRTGCRPVRHDDRDDTPSPLSVRVRQGGNMTLNVEPVAAVIGTCLVAIAVMFAKRFASWIGKAIGRAIIASLRSYWKADMDTELSAKLAPIYAELQIGDETKKWPNGSDTLPQTMQTIYDRQRETWLMVRDMQLQLEAVLADRGN